MNEYKYLTMSCNQNRIFNRNCIEFHHIFLIRSKVEPFDFAIRVSIMEEVVILPESVSKRLLLHSKKQNMVSVHYSH